GFQQARGQRVTTPGYYWLCYTWSNLLYACTACNTSKGSLFPLDNPGARVRNHRRDSECNREVPLIINPALEQPRKYFTFVGPEIVPRRLRDTLKLKKAITTIQAIKLNRVGLSEERLQLLNFVKQYRESLYLDAHT